MSFIKNIREGAKLSNILGFINIKPFCFNLHSFIEINEALVTRFLLAADNGDVSSVVDILDAEVPVDSVGMHGWTALKYAAARNRPDVTRVLLQRGADVNERSGGLGMTALHIASRHNSIDAIRVMMQHGASATVRNNDGETPIDIARDWYFYEAVRIMEKY